MLRPAAEEKSEDEFVSETDVSDPESNCSTDHSANTAAGDAFSYDLDDNEGTCT